MTAEANEKKTRRLYEAVWNERRLDLIEEWVWPDFVGHYSAYPEPVRGVDGFKGMVEDLLRAFPDARLTVQDTVAAADKVASRVLITGTHTGPVVGFAPTGRKIAIEYLAIERYRDGRCAEEWARTDDLGLSRQIGALPQAGSMPEMVAKKLFALRAAAMRRISSGA